MSSVAHTVTASHRAERRARARSNSRATILEAARKVAVRDGAASLSMRNVAAEAGFAPAALYGYFENKSALLIALAAEDLAMLARMMRQDGGTGNRLEAVARSVLEFLQQSETCAAAAAALPAQASSSEIERVFNGRLIAALGALSEAADTDKDSREGQADTVLLAAALTGLAVFVRSGRLGALGFSPADLVAAIGRRFTAA